VADAVKKLLEKDGAEDLGEKYLDGRKVHAYRVKGLKFGGQTVDVTYTVDAKRELPVKVEMTFAGGPLAMTQTLDYLGFDEELDPKLFDLSVPEGYRREELKLPAPAKK
jgi:outer membrane lipoprotein-sorting protein